MIYEIKITGETASVNNPKKETETPKKTIEETTKQNFNITKAAKGTIAIAGTVYTASQTIVQPVLQDKINTAMLNGDTVQARNIQRVASNVDFFVNKGLSVASIGVGFMVNPVLGAVALGASVINEIKTAVNISQKNKSIIEMNKVNNFINGIESQRFVKTIRGE